MPETIDEKPDNQPFDGSVRLEVKRLLDMLPIAGYACDQDGLLIHYNAAAARLWGQSPRLLDPNQRFCGAYRLYLIDGTPLAHTDFAVAESLRTGRPVRDQQVVIGRPDGSRVRALASVEALHDDAGRIVGAINCLHEAAPVGDDNLAILQALPAAIYTTDAAGRITFYNDAAADLWGVRPELGKSEFCGSWKLYWPDGTPLPHDQCPMAMALREQKPNRGLEAVAERPDGSRVPFMPYPSPIFDDEGRLVGAVNMLIDLSELKRGEEVGFRLAAIVESTQDAIVSKTLDGIITSWNGAAEQLFGYTAEEAIGQPIMMLIPPDRTDEEVSIIGRVRRGVRVNSYETIRRRKDGSLVPVSLTVSPVRDRAGRVIGASKVARDITERRRVEEQRELLLREMNHRVKNLFSLANGMVALSTRSAKTPQEMADIVQGRILALASAHELTLPSFSRDGKMAHKATTLKALLMAIVAPHVGLIGDGERVLFHGPDVPVGQQAVTNFALLLHELTTNAAKYGALASPEGRIDVTSAEEQGLLRLVWREHGGPALEGGPQSEGFGSKLAKQAVTGQFGGDILYRWNREGLTVELTLQRDRLAQ